MKFDLGETVYVQCTLSETIKIRIESSIGCDSWDEARVSLYLSTEFSLWMTRRNLLIHLKDLYEA